MSCCSACAARDARNDELALETFERESEVIGGDTRVRVRDTTRAPLAVSPACTWSSRCRRSA